MRYLIFLILFSANGYAQTNDTIPSTFITDGLSTKGVLIVPKPINNPNTYSVFWQSIRNAKDFVSLQAGIDTCVKYNIRNFVIPQGDYHYTKSLILMNPTGGFVQLNIIGESTFWGDGGTRLFYDGTDGFALGIQLGKGCKVQGIQFIGKFTPPFQSDRMKFFNCAFEDFKDGVCRDSKYSPQAGLVIEPFTVNIKDSLPVDGGYPNLTKFYSKSNFSTQTGSTAIIVRECQFNNFVCGIIISPNGKSRNAEILTFDFNQWKNCKLCFASCQDQEKENTITHAYCWGGTHTFFAEGMYGDNYPNFKMAANYTIDHLNLAGALVRIFRCEQSGYNPLWVSNVKGESVGQWGIFGGSGAVGCVARECNVNFEYPSVAGQQELFVSWGGTINVYRDCTFRYYGHPELPMKVTGNMLFDHTSFGGANLITPDQGPTFVNVPK